MLPSAPSSAIIRIRPFCVCLCVSVLSTPSSARKPASLTMAARMTVQLLEALHWRHVIVSSMDWKLRVTPEDQAAFLAATLADVGIVVPGYESSAASVAATPISGDGGSSSSSSSSSSASASAGFALPLPSSLHA